MAGTVQPDKAFADFDSASALLLALSGALDGKPFDYLGQSLLKAVPVRASALLPRALRCRAYAIASGSEGNATRRLKDIDLSGVADWISGSYPER